MVNRILATLCASISLGAIAEETPITGRVESKCVIITDTIGVYGNPSANTLSTATADGGVTPIVRYDAVIADYYLARITSPNEFIESPALDDVVAWTNTVTVAEVSDTGMSAYDTNKIEYDNVTEIDLTIAGSTWFKIDSKAEYGFDKSLPAGTYRALVTAECIAK